MLPGGQTARMLGRDGELFHLEFSGEFSGDVLEFFEAHGEVPLPPYIDRPPEDSRPRELSDRLCASARRSRRADGRTALRCRHLRRARGAPGQACVRHIARRRRHLPAGAGAGHRAARDAHRIPGGAASDLRCHQRRARRRRPRDCRGHHGGEEPGDRRRAGRCRGARAAGAEAPLGAAPGQGPRPFRGSTRLFIKPGYRFRAVDAMVTNFHLPESTLLMLCAAFVGRETLLAAYAHAVEERYRFFSYGDAMFLTPAEPALEPR